MKRKLMILPFLFLLLVPLVMAQSNQTQLGFLSAVENFFVSPFEAISNSIASGRFNRMAAATLDESNPINMSTEVQCDQNGRPLSQEQLGNLEQLLGGITPISCMCRAWGSCTKDACSCDVLCPRSFNIFKRPPTERTTDLLGDANSLAFRNTSFGPDQIPTSIDMTQGYCWGHATVTARFNRLAFFKPEVAPRYDLNSTDPQIKRRALRYYKDIIDDIVGNKPADIPGFTNLNELSSHPDLETYIADKVARVWADRAMSWQGIAIALKDQPQSQRHNQGIFSEVQRNISLNIQPTIVFTYRGSRFRTHACLVSHTQEVDGRTVMCVRDNNWPESTSQNCENYMYMNESGAIIYNDQSGVSEIGGITMGGNDRRDAVNQIRRLQSRCEREKGC